MSARIARIGFNAAAFGREGDLEALDRRIGEQAALGAGVCELNAARLDVVAGCKIIPSRLAALREVLDRHDIAYTLHAPIAVNLMDEAHSDLHLRAAETSLDLAGACGMSVAVFHPGRVPPALWAERGRHLLEDEAAALARLGDHARARGVTLAYENMSPNPRIIAGAETSYALDPAALAEQLAQVDHPAVAACLDVGHAQQGARLRGFDMIDGVRALAPHVGHLHFADATGEPATVHTDTEGERLFFGVGDMHAPPGFGAIDFERLADVLSVRENTALVIELKSNHYGHSANATLDAAHAFAQRVNAAAAGQGAR